MSTIGDVLERHRGIGPGCDFLRISLALLVLFTHSTDIATGVYEEWSSGPWQIPARSLVPMFFALSGFLVTGSAQRLRLPDFILNRAMRIVPALAMVVVFSACILGPLTTTLSLGEYFRDWQVWAYFANIFGIVHYTLPGVFTHNINPDVVNGSLWTVPFEYGCYIIMSIVVLSGLIKDRNVLSAVAASFCALVFAVAVSARHLAMPEGDNHTWTILGIAANFTTNKAGYFLYFYFIAGSLAYQFREKLPFSLSLFLISIICFVAVSLIGAFYSGLLLSKMIFLIPFLTYMTIYIGMLNIPKIPIYSRGDYSYGVYLYGFPLQQALMAAFPNSFTVTSHFLCSVILATGFAMLSWHYVEKPILKLRRKFSLSTQNTKILIEKERAEPATSSVLGAIRLNTAQELETFKIKKHG